jgi:hypothetical protein
MVWACVAVSPEASTTRTVNWKVPAIRAVPVIAPPEERDKPGGRDPDITDQVNGAVPPSTVV